VTATALGGRMGWLSLPEPGPEPLVIILPFAGGGRSFYRDWVPLLKPDVRVGFVNLPGRESRLREPALDDIEPLIEALADASEGRLTGRFGFFGHSMGALLAYEWACALRDRGLPEPGRLIVSGFCSPDTPLPGRPLADVDDTDLMAELESIMELQGAADAGLVRQLVDAMLPAARADFTLCERYRHRPRPPLAADITVLWSSDDPLTTPDGVQAWCRHTSGAFRTRRFGGPHFFIRDHARTVTAEISRQLLASAAPERNRHDLADPV
jgi:medium-chain acyl-[acyl-carrier-protein] hydrolase